MKHSIHISVAVWPLEDDDYQFDAQAIAMRRGVKGYGVGEVRRFMGYQSAGVQAVRQALQKLQDIEDE